MGIPQQRINIGTSMASSGNRINRTPTKRDQMTAGEFNEMLARLNLTHEQWHKEIDKGLKSGRSPLSIEQLFDELFIKYGL